MSKLHIMSIQKILHRDLSRGRNLRNSKRWDERGSRDPDRHDGWFQGSYAKDKDLDRAQILENHFLHLILIQNICCGYSKEPSH